MTDFVEYIPKRHGQKPDYWTPDTLTGLDNKNYVRQPNWAWIAGTTYYVPYEAVHGRPRPHRRRTSRKEQDMTDIIKLTDPFAAFGSRVKRAQIEHDENWGQAVDQMPALRFSPDWMVQIIPPWGGAYARFIVTSDDVRISVYADFNNALGCYKEPYWEIYPAANGDVERFALHDADGLIDGIAKSIDVHRARSKT